MIKENLLKISATVPAPARLIAVSKTKPVEMLQEAYDAGQRLFGENHALEMRDKHELLPKDIEWHLIGHLQTNKVKYIASFVSMIHSIDSLRLLETVDKEAAKHDRVIDCLLQFHIATEETKFGLSMDEARQLLESPEYKAMKNVRICGVMGMATNTDDTALVRSEFANLRSIFNTLKQSYFLNGTQASSPATELMTPANSQDCDPFREISMGMSHDYPIALEEGATLVRVGSAIFGARSYTSM